MKKMLLMLTYAAATLLADYTMVVKNSGEERVDQTIRYRDDSHMNFWIHEAGEGRTAFYIIAKKAYSVNSSDGRIIYIDVDEMRAMFNAMNGMAQAMQEESFEKKREEMNLKVVRKNGTTKVAGIKGEIWVVEYTQKGKKHTEEVVVTQDKGVKTIYHAWGAMFNRVFKPAEPLEFDKTFEVEPGYVVIKMDEMEVVSFSDARLSDKELALPEGAVQQSMKGFSGLFGGGQNIDDPSAEGEATPADETYPHAQERDTHSDADYPEPDTQNEDERVDKAVELLKSLF